jgi:uncharacterized repeat protein (TIGR03803 family)
MGIARALAQTTTEVVLHNFAAPPPQAGPKGAYPYAGVIRDSAGNLYGTTVYGGAANAGVVYKVNTAGNQIVLHSFTGGADGANPYAGVIRDSAGNLYGTAVGGGTAGFGVVYKLDATGHETVLYSFTGGSDGGYPYAGVIRDSTGNLYGTASTGVVYKLDATGHETVLYTFGGYPADGSTPYAGVIRDSAGNLYGTTYYGGAAGYGTAYKLDAAGHETVLHSFKNGADGAFPIAGVVSDSAGNLYGTTREGGGLGEFGVVYKVDPSGQETVLHSFTGLSDGGFPYAGLIRAPSGNLYGTTSYSAPGGGVVFKVNTAGQETVLYSFQDVESGGGPYAGVISDSAGNLYGTTSGGGTGIVGAVYRLDPAGQETVLYSFPGPPDGATPYAGVVRDSAGNLYGTAQVGGPWNAGVVYKLDAAGHETILYGFTGGADGGYPYSGVIRDSGGNLYGTASHGGAWGAGVVYKLDASGHEIVLYSFTGGVDGGGPNGVIRDSAGNLYGTTQGGGTADAGVVYKLDTAGQETVLYSFKGGPDGWVPLAVIRDSAGNLYGTTMQGGNANAGVVYKLDTNGQETVLHSFTGGADGSRPMAGVTLGPAGILYGTTEFGGILDGYPVDAGVVYKVDMAGQEAVLYTFTGGTDGAWPYGGVIRDSAGNLYGTTYAYNIFFGGGPGVVFKLDTALQQETVLYSFTGGADGGYPYAGVTRDSAGNLYGTASSGGRNGGGVVFKVVAQ